MSNDSYTVIHYQKFEITKCICSIQGFKEIQINTYTLLMKKILSNV